MVDDFAKGTCIVIFIQWEEYDKTSMSVVDRESYINVNWDFQGAVHQFAGSSRCLAPALNAARQDGIVDHISVKEYTYFPESGNLVVH